MTPSYLNPPTSPFPQPVEKEANDQVFDHHHHHHHLLFTTTTTTTTSSPTSQASSSSLTFPIFFNPTQDQGGINYDHIDQEQDQQELNKYLFHGGSSSSDHHQFLPIPCHDPTSSVLLPTAESTDHHYEVSNNNYGGLQFSIMNCKQEEMIIKAESCQIENGSSTSSVKWMSSKMRLMRKMMNPDRPRIIVESSTTQKFQQDQHQPISPNSNNNCTIRVCSDCNTTKTPLWRSGPRGPKSLCNACGIRQRKARRAMAAAAAAANGTILASPTTDHTSSSSMRTTTTTNNNNNKGQQQYKKRCKITAPRSKKKICFEDLTINLSKNSDFQRVFPQDEKEAAILLMALSCGLVHG